MILGWKEQFIVARKHKVTKPSTFVNASEAEEVLVGSIPLLFFVLSHSGVENVGFSTNPI